MLQEWAAGRSAPVFCARIVSVHVLHSVRVHWLRRLASARIIRLFAESSKTQHSSKRPAAARRDWRPASIKMRGVSPQPKPSKQVSLILVGLFERLRPNARWQRDLPALSSSLRRSSFRGTAAQPARQAPTAVRRRPHAPLRCSGLVRRGASAETTGNLRKRQRDGTKWQRRNSKEKRRAAP